MNRLPNKVAVITGANSGICLAAAKLFVAEGARVFMTGRRDKELAEAVAAVGDRARGVCGDVSNLADLERLFAIVREEAGTIDVVFANAGGGEFMPLQDISEEHFDRDLEDEAPFDFLGFLDYRPETEGMFNEMLDRLRATREWSFMDREIDIRLAKSLR